MKHFFVITGPSACGKTTLLRLGERNNLWKVAEKYTTRERREGEYPDDTTKRGKEEIYKDSELDFRYIMNKYIYAFSGRKIERDLIGDNQVPGRNVAIVCSDLGTIRKLKRDSRFENRLVVLFIATVPTTAHVTKAWLKREADTAYSRDRNKLEDISVNAFSHLNEAIEGLPPKISHFYDNSRITRNETQSFQEFSDKLQQLYQQYVDLMPNSDSYKARIRNIDKFYYKYIEEIACFDYTILNFFNPTASGNVDDEKMTRQVKNIISCLPENRVPNERNKKALFFICAPKKSGKSILFSNLNLMSRTEIEIVKKIALRYDKNTKEDLLSEKGDGYGRSETYWMFDKENETHINGVKLLNELKSSAGDEENWDTHTPLVNYVASLLPSACNRIKELFPTSENADDAAARDVIYDFTKWYWHFQGNYYAVDTNAILNEEKHSVLISNIGQLSNARAWAEKAKKLFVPIFLVYVDYDERARNYYGGDTYEKIQETIESYYDKIGEFRHVILNTGINEDVHDQISNIIRRYQGWRQ